VEQTISNSSKTPGQIAGSGGSGGAGLRAWLPVISMMLVSVISYVDRNTLALLAPTILKDTGLNAEQYGFIISAFSIAYMVGNPLWGWILDRIGVRRGMLASVAMWTVASASHAFAAGFGGFAMARALLGFGEGATFPGSMRTAIQSLPAQSRSRGIALSYSGGSLGAIITPLLVTPIAVRWGWRGAFWFTGAIGALWVLHWAVLSRRKELGQIPQRVAASNEQPGLPVGASRSIGWGDARLWGFICAYALGALPLGFVLYEAALFLSGVLHKSQAQIGAVLWIPPLGWEVGYFFWGWVTDRIMGGHSEEAMGRAAQPESRAIRGMRTMFLAITALSLPLMLIPWIDSFVATMALFFFAMFVAAGYVIGSLAYANSYYSSRHAGFIAGMGAGMWSLMVGIVMPFFGRLFDQHLYHEAFAVAALIPVLGYVLWRWLDGRPASPAVSLTASSTVFPAE
jgi:ACS family hexuronate transporter-like MFS transporter